MDNKEFFIQKSTVILLSTYLQESGQYRSEFVSMNKRTSGCRILARVLKDGYSTPNKARA